MFMNSCFIIILTTVHFSLLIRLKMEWDKFTVDAGTYVKDSTCSGIYEKPLQRGEHISSQFLQRQANSHLNFWTFYPTVFNFYEKLYLGFAYNVTKIVQNGISNFKQLQQIIQVEIAAVHEQNVRLIFIPVGYCHYVYNWIWHRKQFNGLVYSVTMETSRCIVLLPKYLSLSK